MFLYAAAVTAAGAPIIAAAGFWLGRHPPDLKTGVGALLLFACALVAEMNPVPINVEGTRVVTLAFLFVITAQTQFGWAYGVLIGSGAMLAALLATGTAALRTAFNTSVYAIAAGAAALPASVNLLQYDTGRGVSYRIATGAVLVQGLVFIAVNVGLVCLVIALAEAKRPLGVIIDHLRHSGPAFAIMGILAALAVTLWMVDPPLLVLLVGPLLALGLYQRHALGVRVAEQAAATDDLTELNNHRAYKEAIREAVAAAVPAAPITLCLVDVDDFKGVNDRFGHLVGDDVLVLIAGSLSTDSRVNAFRLGGDEFALVVEGDGDEALRVVEAFRTRIEESIFPHGLRPTISAGIATCPAMATSTVELQRLADIALYWTKRHGKNKSSLYDTSMAEPSLSQELAEIAELEARLRAAENLIRVVDARDTYAGNHSARVAKLAESIGIELGLDEAALSSLRLAALLHDLGKIAVPDSILQKPGPLTKAETVVLRRHPEMGSELLAGIDVGPVDDWIRHHHEHWDGTGYPAGLTGAEIPIGSRIILVADAFDAITSDRSYRAASDVRTALAEVIAESDRQFDPTVVTALIGLMQRDGAVPANAAPGRELKPVLAA